MHHVIRVRDIARGGVYDLGPAEPMLRGSYDLFHPSGAALRRGVIVQWEQAGDVRTSRTVAATLGDAHPGERVLLLLRDARPNEGHEENPEEEEWWLCEVEAVDGVAAAL